MGAARDYHDQRKVAIVRGRMDYYENAIQAISKSLCAKWVMSLPEPQIAYNTWSTRLVAKMGISKELDNLWTKSGYQPTPSVRLAYGRVLEAVSTERNRCVRTDFLKVYGAAKEIYEKPVPNTMSSQVCQ